MNKILAICVFFLLSLPLWASDTTNYLESLEITSGSSHVCALTVKGIKCFGNSEERTLKVPSNLIALKELHAGNRFTCAIVKEGIRCWGEIPNNTKSDILISNKVLSMPKLLSVGYGHACGVSNNNLIKCWGGNEYGESQAPQNLTNITELSLGMNNSCAIANGSVVCWGLAGNGSLAVPANLVNPRNLSSGWWHHCVQTDEGMKCWGYPYKEFVAPDDSSLKTFSSGGFYNCGLVEAGVKCWDETGKTVLVPESAGATKLAVGSTIACAITTVKGVICWSLIDNPKFNLLQSFVPAGFIQNIEHVAAGDANTCVFGDEGHLKCWGANFNGALNVPKILPGSVSKISIGSQKTCAISDSVLSCWGTKNSDYDMPKGLGNVTYVSSGGSHICAGNTDLLKCWGDNSRGALDIPKNMSNFSQVSSGFMHACAVTNGQVICWGGEGLIKNVNPPKKMTEPKAICAGGTFSCGIDNSGAIACWGEKITKLHDDQRSAMEDPNANAVLSVPREIQEATEISCGLSHACAIYKGKIKCWGNQDFLPERLTPGLTIKNPRELSAGMNHTCALGDNGLNCWGSMLNMAMPTYSLEK